MSKFRLIKWHLFSEEAPVSPGEYLVIINGAEIATVLYYDALAFDWLDDDENYYSVKYWAELPDHPDGVQEPIIKDLERKYSMTFTAGQIIAYREYLSFIINYCDVPRILQKDISSLIVSFENIMSDRR